MLRPQVGHRNQHRAVLNQRRLRLCRQLPLVAAGQHYWRLVCRSRCPFLRTSLRFHRLNQTAAAVAVRRSAIPSAVQTTVMLNRYQRASLAKEGGPRQRSRLMNRFHFEVREDFLPRYSDSQKVVAVRHWQQGTHRARLFPMNLPMAVVARLRSARKFSR